MVLEFVRLILFFVNQFKLPVLVPFIQNLKYSKCDNLNVFKCFSKIYTAVWGW